jgi:alkylation response protein AidB-like acyl-CoA dehydrogenase
LQHPGIKKLKKIAKSELSDGRPLLESELFSRKVAELEIDLLALEFTELRAVDDSVKGTGAEASILKLGGSEIHQRISELKLEAVAYHGFPFIYGPKGLEAGEFSVGPEYARFTGSTYVGSRAATLYGGSSEIQRGIVAKHVLGL